MTPQPHIPRADQRPIGVALQCDGGCGADFLLPAPTTERELDEAARAAGWLIVQDWDGTYHYCPNCRGGSRES